MKTLNLSASVDLQAASGDKQPTVQILAYGGGVIAPGGWGELVLDVSGITAADQIPLLADHSATTDGVAGHGKATMSAGRITVSGVLIRGTEAADKVLTLSAGGLKLQASVGVNPTSTKRLQAGETITVNGKKVTAGQHGLTIVTAGRLQEVSILPLGADSGTTVDITARQGTERMSATNETTEQQDALTAERQRVGAIAKIAAAHPSILEAAIEGGWDAQRTELEVLRASRPTVPPAHVAPTITSNRNDGRSVLAAALLVRMNREAVAVKAYGEQCVEFARHSEARTSLVDMCRCALKLAFQPIPGDRSELIRAAFSTTSLPSSISDAVHNSVKAQYAEVPQTWRAFAAIKSVVDFRDHSSVSVNHNGALQPLSAAGEITHGNLDTSSLTYSIDTYAKMFRLTRRDVINDAINALDEVPTVFARQAARKVSDLVYSTLLGNAGSHFASGNANSLSGGSSALSVTSLGNAIKTLRQQRDGEGNDLDIAPVALLVPPDLEETAKQILESDALQRYVASGTDQKPMGNPYKGALTLQVEPRLSNSTKFSTASTTAWYLFAGPIDQPFIVAFLDGQQAPRVEFFGMESDVDTLGVSWRVYHDVGCAFGDYRAAVKSAGA